MTEIDEETVRAAQKHDCDSKPDRPGWRRVPDGQVARLIEGALAAERERAARTAERAVRDLMTENFGEVINRITDETMTAKLAEVEAAVRADERRRSPGRSATTSRRPGWTSS